MKRWCTRKPSITPSRKLFIVLHRSTCARLNNAEYGARAQDNNPDVLGLPPLWITERGWTLYGSGRDGQLESEERDRGEHFQELNFFLVKLFFVLG